MELSEELQKLEVKLESEIELLNKQSKEDKKIKKV